MITNLRPAALQRWSINQFDPPGGVSNWWFQRHRLFFENREEGYVVPHEVEAGPLQPKGQKSVTARKAWACLLHSTWTWIALPRGRLGVQHRARALDAAVEKKARPRCRRAHSGTRMYSQDGTRSFCVGVRPPSR